MRQFTCDTCYAAMVVTDDGTHHLLDPNVPDQFDTALDADHPAEDTRTVRRSSADSQRWCATCAAWGDHHTDRHPLYVTTA